MQRNDTLIIGKMNEALTFAWSRRFKTVNIKEKAVYAIASLILHPPCPFQWSFLYFLSSSRSFSISVDPISNCCFMRTKFIVARCWFFCPDLLKGIPLYPYSFLDAMFKYTTHTTQGVKGKRYVSKEVQYYRLFFRDILLWSQWW